MSEETKHDKPHCVICGGDFTLEESIHNGPFHEKCAEDTERPIPLAVRANGILEGQLINLAKQAGFITESAQTAYQHLCDKLREANVAANIESLKNRHRIRAKDKHGEYYNWIVDSYFAIQPKFDGADEIRIEDLQSGKTVFINAQEFVYFTVEEIEDESTTERRGIN